MSAAQQIPTDEKLSVTLGNFIYLIENTEALSAQQFMEVIGFLRRHLPELKTFVDDYEFADTLTNPRVGPALMASAATRLYLRMTAPSAPIIAMRPPAGAPLVDLDRFRRGGC